jgi:hypothetical protein
MIHFNGDNNFNKAMRTYDSGVNKDFLLFHNQFIPGIDGGLF